MNILFHLVNHLISWVTPKTKGIWLYGEWFGEKCCDNSYYAFVEKSSIEIRKIWITKNHNVLSDLRRKGYECYDAHSIKGLYYQARAKVFFCSINSRDFCFSSLTPRVYFFQLWHGLPLKKIGFDVENRALFNKIIDFVRSKTIDRYSYVLSPSNFYDSVFSSAFRVPKKKMIRSLCPRCDGLFLPEESKGLFLKRLSITTRYIAFYLPTHRMEGACADKIQALISDIKELNNDLSALDVTLVVKPHFYEVGNFKEERLSHVVVTEDLPFDLYTCLAWSDFIITDYSSVALDYCVTKKPIFYFTPDLEDYSQNDRSGYFDYNDILQDPCTSIDGLKESIIQYLKHGVCPSLLKLEMPDRPAMSISARVQKIAESKVYEG